MTFPFPHLPIAAIALFALVGARGQPGPSSSDFAAADERTKGRMLASIADATHQMPVEDAMRLVRLGAEDSSALVRQAAMAAVTSRTIISGWAGTPGPQISRAPGRPAPAPAIVPSEWRDDQRTLRLALHDLCVSRLRSDSAVRVRREALRALINLYAVPVDIPSDERLVELLIERYRNDGDGQVRSFALGSLASIGNDTSGIRAVLSDGLVDGDEMVRRAALRALEPQRRRKLSFADARAVIASGLTNADGGLRWGAVRALNLFGAAAREYVPQLQALRSTDPDARVRESAALAVEALERDIGR